MKNRVLLIYPSAGAGQMDLIPLSLLYIAQPLLENQIEVDIFDQRFEKDFPAVLESRLGSDLICIGISCITGPQIAQVRAIAEFVRERTRAPIVIGGTHATILPQQTLASNLVDYVVIGRGEAPFLKLVKALKDGRPVRGFAQTGSKETGMSEVIRDPAVAAVTTRIIPYHLVLKYGNPSVIPLVSSFGCTRHCSFCAEKVIHPQYAEVPLDDVLFMIKDALQFAPQLINFFDANFLLHTGRTMELFAQCRQNGLFFEAICSSRVDSVLQMENAILQHIRQQGIVSIFFGVESGSPKILKLINKQITPEMVISLNLKLRDLGIKPHYSFMAGFPTETKDDFDQTLGLIDRLKKDNPRAVVWKLNTYTPYPGTPLFEVALREGFIPPETFEKWSDVHFYARNYTAPYDLRL